jgi:hypothetical protein
VGIVLHSFAQIQQAHSKIHDPSGRALKILNFYAGYHFLFMNLRTFTIHSFLAQAQSCSLVMRPHCSTLQLCMIDLVKAQTIPSGDSHSVYFKDPQIITPYSTHNLRVLSQWTMFSLEFSLLKLEFASICWSACTSYNGESSVGMLQGVIGWSIPIVGVCFYTETHFTR